MHTPGGSSIGRERDSACTMACSVSEPLLAGSLPLTQQELSLLHNALLMLLMGTGIPWWLWRRLCGALIPRLFLPGPQGAAQFLPPLQSHAQRLDAVEEHQPLQLSAVAVALLALQLDKPILAHPQLHPGVLHNTHA